MFEDLELVLTSDRSCWNVRRGDNRLIRFGQTHSLDESLQSILGELPQTVEVGELRLRGHVGVIEPVPQIRLPMHAKRRANGIAVLAVIDPVLSRKDFYAFFQTAALDRNPESERKVVDVDSALGGQ